MGGQEALRQLPKVDRLAAHLSGVPGPVATIAARVVVAEARAQILAGGPLPDDLAARALAAATDLAHGRLRPVINATGIVVHTNLGRAPWSDAARQAALRAAGYCDLELLRTTGKRGGRLRGVTAQLQALTGAEAALVVNNCAAAVLLGLTALAHGREVVVSRGELVEIGGSFRVPDVISSGGARLREVGTTNRTRARDYAAVVGPDTGALLVVHPSNFRVVGFTEVADRRELVALGREHGVPVLEDVGAGSLDGAYGETSVREAVGAGLDLVFFSGDKLLGGPQAGIVVGREEAVATLRRHPLYRALRVGKVTLAALEATLGEHLAGTPPPVLEMIRATPEALQTAALALCTSLGKRGVDAEVAPDTSYVGGGALPEQGLPTSVVRIAVDRPDDAARALRLGDPAILVRVSRGALHVDPRTLRPGDAEALAPRLAEVLGAF